jgi:hypothetical protein
VERDPLPQGQGAGGVPEVVEADICREARLLEESPEGAHHGVAPADLPSRVREDEAGTAQEVETNGSLTGRVLSRVA